METQFTQVSGSLNRKNWALRDAFVMQLPYKFPAAGSWSEEEFGSSCNVTLYQSFELFVYATRNDMILHISCCLAERRFGFTSKHVIAPVSRSIRDMFSHS